MTGQKALSTMDPVPGPLSQQRSGGSYWIALNPCWRGCIFEFRAFQKGEEGTANAGAGKVLFKGRTLL